MEFRRERIPVYLIQVFMVLIPIFSTFIAGLFFYIFYTGFLTNTKKILDKTSEEFLKKEIEFRKEYIRNFLLSFYEEEKRRFEDYKWSLLEKNILQAREFLKNHSAEELLNQRFLYGDGIVYYIKDGYIYHPHSRGVLITTAKDDRGNSYLKDGVSRAIKFGRTFIEYWKEGKRRLTYVEYFPEEKIFLVTSGDEERLKRNYRYKIKTDVINIVKTVSQFMPLIMEEVGLDFRRLLIDTTTYEDRKFPSFSVDFPDIGLALTIYVKTLGLAQLIDDIKMENDLFLEKGLKSFFAYYLVPFLSFVVAVAILLGWWINKEIDTLSVRLFRATIKDPRTGGYNHTGLRTSVERLKVMGFENAVVILCDVENFRAVNSQSREKGDEFLNEIYNHLVKVFPSEKFRGVVVGRQEADRFVIVVPVNEDIEKEVINIAQESISSITFNGLSFKFYVVVDSIKLKEVDFDRVIDELFEALKRAKGEKRYFVIVDDELRKRMEIDNRLYLQLKIALNEEKITFAIQPIVEADSLSPIGYEVLGRIFADGEIKSIYSYISSVNVRNTDLQMRITKKVIEKALRFKMVNYQRFAGKYFSVNVSKMLLVNDFYPFILSLLEKTGYPPEELVVEVLERDSYDEKTAEIFRKLRKEGIRIAIDDFGVEKANIMTMVELPVDIVKFDGSFLRKAERDENVRKLLKGLNEIIKDIGKRTIIEMVETEKMIELSKELGFSLLQGYAVGKLEVPEKNY
ncbi:EAL domain-containing protein [Desulfurobacterium crinifex]